MGRARLHGWRVGRWGPLLAALTLLVALTGQAAPAAAARAEVAPGWPSTVVSVAVGNFHTCAVLDNGQVKCWGYNGNGQLDDGQLKCWGLNDHGQLGLGDTADRGDVPGEMGDRPTNSW